MFVYLHATVKSYLLTLKCSYKKLSRILTITDLHDRLIINKNITAESSTRYCLQPQVTNISILFTQQQHQVKKKTYDKNSW